MTLRFFRWIIRKIGLRTLVAFSLLYLAVGSSAYGLADVIRGLEKSLLLRLILVAILVSWLLARTKIRTGWAASLLLFTGFLYLIISIGQLMTPIFALLKVSSYLIWEYSKLPQDVLLDFGSFNFAYAEVYYGVAELLSALWEWIISIKDGLPLYDVTAISLVWGMVSWITASWAGWVLIKTQKPVLSVMPSAILLSSILSYSWASTATLVPLLIASLLLKAFVNFDSNEQHWLTANMDYPEDLAKEFTMTSVAVVLGIVALATFLPIFSINNIVDFIQQFTKPQIDEAEPVIQSFGLEQKSLPREEISRAIQGGLPRSHLIGSGPELAEQVVMTVRLSAGVPRQGRRYLDFPFYWRSLTYDEYLGVGWRSTDIVMRSYKAGENAISPESPYHQTIQQDFRMAGGETRFLYAAGEILSADDDFKIAYRPTPRYTEVLDAHGDFFGASIDQSAYRVQSLIPVVDENDLRSVQGEYPRWILERYLDLPDSVPTRVFRLSQELTRNDRTGYDKARTLEKYLRTYEYTLDVGLPPPRQDMVDYFLFDLQKGYCDYYASAMVVMLRGLGIPARIVIGYYRGNFDEINNRFVVTEADAHSWVEVYFPEIGWVSFEPTAGRAEIERLSRSLEIPEVIDDVQPLSSLDSRVGRFNWYWLNVLLIVIGGISLIVLGFFIIDNVRIYSFAPAKALNQLYQRLYRMGRGLQAPAQKGDTPNEFAQELGQRLISLSSQSVFEKFIIPGISEINEITNIYTRMLYSPFTLTMPDRELIINLWRRIRRRLWLARFRQLAYRFRTNTKS